MAKIDFPVAILDGQEFTASTGVVYTYVGTPPNGYWSAEVNGGGGGGVTQDLQSVTDEGNTTTNEILIGGTLPSAPNITMNTGGNITTLGRFQADRTVANDGTFRSALNGVVKHITYADGTTYIGSDGDVQGADKKIVLNANGTATFAGTVSSKSYFASDRDAAGKSLYSGSVNGVENLNIIADGSIYAGNIAGSGTAGPGNINIQLNASSGSAEFGGRGRFGNTSTGYAGPAVSGYANTSTTNSGGIQIKNFGTGANFSSFNASGNNTAYIMADGSATFAGNVQVGGASYGNENGLVIEKTGGIRVTNNTGSYHLFRGYTRDNPANTTSITAEGLGQFKKIQLPADVTIPRIALDGSDGTATFSPGTGDFVIGEDGFIRSSRLGQYCWMNADINSIGAVAFGTAPVNDAANPSFYVKLDGSAQFAGTVTATVVPPSDARFKENITPAKSQLADVVALGGLLKNYDWNDDAPLNEELRSQRQLGLVAQEAAEVCPSIVKDIYRTKTVEVTPAVTGPKGRVLTEAVTQEIDDSYKGISQDALIMKLIGAVSEQQALIKVLTQRLDDVGV